MSTMFWIWLVVTALFLIIELMTPTMVYICFVAGGLAAAVYAQIYPDAYPVQIAVFIVISLILLPFTRKLARKISRPSPELSNIDRMIDQVAIVIEKIDQDLGGKIQFEGEVWIARADEDIETNCKVKIISISGTRLNVERLSQ